MKSAGHFVVEPNNKSKLMEEALANYGSKGSEIQLTCQLGQYSRVTDSCEIAIVPRNSTELSRFMCAEY